MSQLHYGAILHTVWAVTVEWEIGPSEVRALPLAAGTNEGGHYFSYFGPSGAAQTVSDSRRPLF